MEENPREFEIREKLDRILVLLREEKAQATTAEKGRAVSTAITQLEIASMCVVRSFFATEPYSPKQLLKKV